MAQWAVIIPADRWATERLFQNDTVTVAGGAGAVAADDEVLLVADGAVVALTRAVKSDGDGLVLAYLRRAFDEPVPADELTAATPLASAGSVTAAGSVAAAGLRTAVVALPVEPEVFRRLAAALGARPEQRRSWLVSVALPIEAATPSEAVRQFWSHLLTLGPGELPTYVWPSGDELAMQAFVLGGESNQDPEEGDED